jgi:hypothetical protein
MDETLPVGWMRMGLRARVCNQCRPRVAADDAALALAPNSCESKCALFTQLPRLAHFLARYRAKPPAGYEDSVLKLLCDSSKDISGDIGPASVPEIIPGPFLDYSIDALAILEKIAALFVPPAVENPGHDCTRRAMALGQMSVHGSRSECG